MVNPKNAKGVQMSVMKIVLAQVVLAMLALELIETFPPHVVVKTVMQK
jgi:hypothetical protein